MSRRSRSCASRTSSGQSRDRFRSISRDKSKSKKTKEMTNFFKSDTPHGFVKRHIFRRHCQAFVAKTQQANCQTIIYDAFAGTGCYSDDLPSIETDSPDLPIDINKLGSPLIALCVVMNFFGRKNKIRYYSEKSRQEVSSELKGKIEDIKNDIQMPEPEKFVILNFSEADKDNCLKLVNNIIKVLLDYYHVGYTISPNSNGVITIKSRDPKFPFCINVACTEFTHVKPPNVMPNRRLLTFIDPFGYSQIPMHHVQGFIGEHREALINFMSSFVNRFKEQEKNEAAICELYGFNVEEKSERLAELRFQSNEGKGIDRCLETYEEELKKRTKSGLILTFTICNKNNARLYHLTFITNHIEGFKAMKEAMNEGSQDADSLRMSDYSVEKNGIQLSLGNDQNDVVVAETIFQEFQGREKVKIRDIEDFIWFKTPFVWRKKPLKILQKEPKNNPRLTTVADNDGTPPEIKYTFPDDKEWLLTFGCLKTYEAELKKREPSVE